MALMLSYWMLFEKNKTIIETVYKAVRQACQAAGREPIPILAVSKNQSVERIGPLLEIGHRWFGESRVQETANKWVNLRPQYPDLLLHLIGPLQTNKAKQALKLFDVIESIDRPQLVLALSKEWQKSKQRVCKILIQVNTGREPQKSGVLKENLPALIDLCHAHNLPLTGLMCIPPSTEDSTYHFQLLADLAHMHKLADLSMGMSGDYPMAIAHGASWVRVGSAFWPLP
ncbi:MAG: YggS family pyridoxal phosphate-dependent enzyme [Candidatus Paracaedibacter sp.]